jgi:hypothetical protein
LKDEQFVRPLQVFFIESLPESPIGREAQASERMSMHDGREYRLASTD